MSCNSCLNNVCCCDKTTTTTKCFLLPVKHCVQVCDDYIDPSCIIYDGDDIECYGLKKGDTVADIFNLIFERLDLLNCSCDYGNIIIQNVTTTTTVPPTTSTSTTTEIQPISLCFVYAYERAGSPPYEQIIISPSTTKINGKYYYEFEYVGGTYRISWNSTLLRWELIDINTPLFIIATLNIDSVFPIGDLFNSWTNVQQSTLFVTTRLNCVNPVYVTVETEEGIECIELHSYWNTNDTVNPPLTNKPEYIVDLDFVDRITWNAFTNVYEFYSGDKIAYTTNSNAIDNNWVLFIGSNYFSVSSSTISCQP